MIAIIDYDGGNYKSVINVLRRMKCDYILTNKPNEISEADKIILPGVSNFNYCMKSLMSLNLDKILFQEVIIKKKKILGICSGMQVFASFSEEENTNGLNLINGVVRKIKNDKFFRVPHMGWNKVNTENNLIFKEIKNFTRFYFCHSYHFSSKESNINFNYTSYGEKICAALNFKNIYGVQFHPEKSFNDGYKLLRNFIEIC